MVELYTIIHLCPSVLLTLATLHSREISSVNDLLKEKSKCVLFDNTLLKLHNYLFYEILQDRCDAVKVDTLELTREAPLYQSVQVCGECRLSKEWKWVGAPLLIVSEWCPKYQYTNTRVKCNLLFEIFGTKFWLVWMRYSLQSLARD